MPMPVTKPSFAGGEFSPKMYGRVDLQKYQIGAKTMRNYLVYPQGGAANRPGTRFIGEVRDSTQKVRLIPFSYSNSQTYVLEFGNNYLRFITNGGYLTETPIAITGITIGSTTTIYCPSHGFTTGDDVYFASVGGTTRLNGNRYRVTVLTSNTFSIPVDTTAWGSYTSGGTVARVYQITTPYLSTDLSLLKFAQSADVLTICHPSYAPRDLARVAVTNWTLTAISFATKTTSPTGLTATPTVGSSASVAQNYAETFTYVVTAIDDTTGEESLASTSAAAAMYHQWAADGYVTLSWTAVSNVTRYNVYRRINGLYGLIGIAQGTTFKDTYILPDTTQTPPTNRDPFTPTSAWPACVTYYEQRKMFAGGNSSPQTIWGTQSGNYKNMNVSIPTKADDALTRTIAANEVQTIKHMVPANMLLVFTASGEWKCWGGSGSDVLTPSSMVLKVQSGNGCSDVPPILVNNRVLFVQAKGSIVRDLGYEWASDTFNGVDLTVMSDHLFQNHTITEWAYQKEPHKVTWCIRDDGIVLGLTYLKEQELVAWHRHDTSGTFESVACVSEGSEDAVYFVVNRTIGGVTKRYVERLASRYFTRAADAWFVDCGLSYKGTATKTVYGLDHLEGQTVTILADGNVEPTQKVVNGSVTISHAASTITVGLGYTADLETLNVEAGQGSIQGVPKKITAVTVRLQQSRGVKVGPDADHLREIKERQYENYGTAIPLKTQDERITIDPLWQTNGTILIRQDNPLPAAITAVIPELTVAAA